MRYVIKQKMITFGDDFSIKDESGNEIFYVDGKAFSFVPDLSLRDDRKNELARIKKKILTFAPTFSVYRDGQLAATMKKSLFSFRPKFLIDVPGPDDYTVIGNFFLYDYKIYKNGKIVAQISKKILFAVTDSYGVEIDDGEDSVLLLCGVIVIDMVLSGKRSKK